MTKVLEDGGASARSGLIKSNQFPREKCEREDCVLCFQQQGESKGLVCDKSNIGYEGKCSRCPNRCSYIGESSRTGYTRLKEHLRDYRAAAAARLPAQLQQDWVALGVGEGRCKDVKSFMWEHTRDCHDGVVGQNNGMEDYEVKVTGRFRKCLLRQVDEDIRMQECESGGGKLLNSRNFS